MKRKVALFLDRTNIKPLLYLIFIANLLDAYFTLGWINTGVATEANPLMAFLLDLGPVWFLSGKIGAVTLACLILLYCKHLRAAKVVLIIANILYLAILGIHLYGIYVLGLPLFRIL